MFENYIFVVNGQLSPCKHPRHGILAVGVADDIFDKIEGRISPVSRFSDPEVDREGYLNVFVHKDTYTECINSRRNMGC